MKSRTLWLGGGVAALSVFAVATAASADITAGFVTGSLSYFQTGPTTVTPQNGGLNGLFSANIDYSDPSEFDGGYVTFPGGGVSEPFNASPLAGTQGYLSDPVAPAKLSAHFPAGTYTLTGTKAGGASQSVDVFFRADTPSATPALTAASYAGIQTLDPSSDFTMNFNSFTADPNAVSGDVFIYVYDLSKAAYPFQVNVDPGTTSVTIPAGTLTAGDAYQYSIAFINQDIAFNPSLTIGDSSWSYTWGTFAISPPSSPASPLLPDSSADGKFSFTDPVSASWFDPVSADGYDYVLTGADFTAVSAPPPAYGFGPVKVIVNGRVVDILDPGGTYDFGPGINQFLLEGVRPEVNPTDPSAFPTFLTFSGSPTGLTITPVPEPQAWAMTLIGLGALGGLLRSRRRTALEAQSTMGSGGIA